MRPAAWNPCRVSSATRLNGLTPILARETERGTHNLRADPVDQPNLLAACIAAGLWQRNTVTATAVILVVYLIAAAIGLAAMADRTDSGHGRPTIRRSDPTNSRWLRMAPLDHPGRHGRRVALTVVTVGTAEPRPSPSAEPVLSPDRRTKVG